MSLRDTIEAARKEAQEAGVLPKAGAEDANDKAESDEERAGFTRRSVAVSDTHLEVGSSQVFHHDVVPVSYTHLDV
ncbi:hypothetical protein [Olsenella massiliensis]|uniref:hypothetical protein n=1 Tax=Olsenella massiliensis TaxID=1622075 RepID=UPI00071DDE53|nr:hypothetical protein [Olsenella massiliensis]